MIGYAPFLGQVTLRHGLGQQFSLLIQLFRAGGPPITDHPLEVSWLAAGESAGRSARTDQRGIAEIPVPSTTTTVRVTPGPLAGHTWDPPALQKDVTGGQGNYITMSAVPVDRFAEIPYRGPAEEQVPSGIPTWAYVVGGLAVAGLVAYAATR